MPRSRRRSRSPSRHTRSRRSSSPSRQQTTRDRYPRNDSPPRTRQRSRERDSYYRSIRSDYDHRHRKRSRSPSRTTRRSRSRSPRPHRHSAKSISSSPTRTDSHVKDDSPTEEALEGMTEEEQMNALLGFSGFDTTKNKQISGNNVGGTNVKKQRKFRQYMNRKGGFNRLLDKQTM